MHDVTFIKDLLCNILPCLKKYVDDIDVAMCSTDTPTCIRRRKRRRSPRTSCCGCRNSTKASFGSCSTSCASDAAATWPRCAGRRRRAAASTRKCTTTRRSGPYTRSSSCLIPTTGGAASRPSATSGCVNDESR